MHVYAKGVSLELFHPLVREWFVGRFGGPTEPQIRGWPAIAANRNTLIAAPTGSGKTLSAFLVCLDQLWRQWLDGELADGIQVVYVSPLKALSNDIEHNLRVPLTEIRELAEQRGFSPPPIRVAVRTGDTPAGQRQAMLRRPPHILVTTPESLYLMVTSERPRKLLASCRTVIVDEIHALARDKRGSHLSLTLERLAALCLRPPVRIGLSATQRPIEAIGQFLVGAGGNGTETPSPCPLPHRNGGEGADGTLQRNGGENTEGTLKRLGGSRKDGTQRPPDEIDEGERGSGCQIVDAGHVRPWDLAVEVPGTELGAVCSLEQWSEVYARLTELILGHRSTLLFVNTRRMAERVSHQLRELLGEDAVAGHHGSLSRGIRHSAEQRLKTGQLRAVVATASLEMGIDVGSVDLVCQLGSPRSIATFLQRVGRSGHSLGSVPKGRLFPLTRDELLECLALVRCVRRGELDRIEIPEQPLDILAQQIIAMVSCEDWHEDSLFQLCTRAWPYRHLSRSDFADVLRMVSQGITATNRRGAYLHRDQIQGRLRARRGARLAALTSGGAIPENGEYRVVTDEDQTLVGTVDEDFAIESMAGDIFLLGNTSWRIRHVRSGEVVVRDALGAPPTIPFWFGEGRGRTIELSAAVSSLRSGIAARLTDLPAPEVGHPGHASGDATMEWFLTECGGGEWAAVQALRYVAAQVTSVGLVPTTGTILFERFFDESGGMQLVVHSPWGARINRAWGLAFRKRFCRSFDFELQAAATDNGVLLSLGPQHSVPIESLFRMLGPHNGQHLLEQAVLAAPMFQVRWRWNVTRSLCVLRQQHGKKVPPYLQRFRSDDLLAAVFPETVGCLENHHGDVVIPDHPLVRQTMHDCLREAMDVSRWLEVLQGIVDQRIELVAKETREPSPFCHELLNANPYAFLDDAPLEERRTRAVAMRRTLPPAHEGDMGRLDGCAIDQVSADAWPLVRSAEELHDALMNLVALREEESPGWEPWFHDLIDAGRATRLRIPDSPITFWLAAERLPVMRAVFPTAIEEPPVQLPDELSLSWSSTDGCLELIRGRIAHAGPTTSSQLAERLGLATSQVDASLEALEGQGLVLRGPFRPRIAATGETIAETSEWCDRRLLARIHRLTLDGLRKQIQPVEPADYLQFLVSLHGLNADAQDVGPGGVREAIGRLQGFEMPAAVWEQVLAARVHGYQPEWLDELFLSGEVVWGRLRSPARSQDRSSRLNLAAMTRAMPISLMFRTDLPWLLPHEPTTDSRGVSDQSASAVPAGSCILRANAERVAETLTTRGALFFQELVALTELLPYHVQVALRELSALGLVTCDGFASVRQIVAPGLRGRRDSQRERRVATGRWSLFPGVQPRPSREHSLEQWCQLLLRRYGIVFRDGLGRETTAPSWFELVPILRRMELRGQLRGGRFLRGVSGEQYGTESAVQRLRQLRDTPDPEWYLLSAADPLNLHGMLTDEPRLPATHKNALVVRAGKRLAMRQAGTTTLSAPLDPMELGMIRRALQVGARPDACTTAQPSGQ